MLVVVPPIEVSAATTYEFLFPVNNGGVNIAFLYGYTSAYGSEFHRGIDIYSNGDDTIYAAFSGTVTWVANSCPCVTNPNNCPHTNTWGNCVQIKSNDGKFYGIYGHLKQNSILVSNGQKVEKGQPLASMGSSGYSFGKHLHFELRVNGVAVDPIKYIKQEKNTKILVFFYCFKTSDTSKFYLNF